MNFKNSIYTILVIFLLQGVVTPVLSQQSKLDSIRSLIEQASENSEQQFEQIMKLADTYRSISPRNKRKVGFQHDFLRYGTNALLWAEKNGTPIQIAQARTFEFSYFIYYKLRIDINDVAFFSSGQKLLNDGIFNSKEDEYFVYKSLVEHYAAKGFYYEQLALLPRKYELGRLLHEPFTSISNEYGEIGIVHFRLKDYKRARKYLKGSLNSIESETSALKKATSINNVALTFAQEGSRDSAIYYYQIAIEVLEKYIGSFDRKTTEYHRHMVNVVKANIAYLNVQDGAYDEAIAAIKKELSSGKSVNELTTIVQAYYKLGEIYYYKKEYEIAETYLDSTKTLLDKGGIHDPEKIKILKQRAKIMLATNRQVEGDRLFKKARIYEDSIDFVKSTDQTKIASILYETQVKENVLQSQKLELAKRNEEIHKNEKIQNLYAIIVGILFISLLLFLWSFNKTKLKKREIEVQKQLVDASLKEKETLLKEVHHRVKNNLQMVSSLLIKQGAITDNEQVKRLMQDGQNRIKSMAMVHQLLYQTEDFRNVNLKEYTELLVGSISGSHQFKGMNISIQILMKEIVTHIDIAVPFGLILNELISNAFEHGFPDGGEGEIEIAVEPLEGHTYKLIVRDTGQGLPDDFHEKAKKSLGINLIKGLTWQLRGTFTYDNSKQGSEFIIYFQNNLKEIG